MGARAAVNKVNEDSWLEVVPAHGPPAFGLLWIRGKSGSRVKMSFSPLARCLMTIESLGRGPGIRRFGSPPSGGRLITAFSRLAEVWMIVPRKVEGEGAVPHATRLRQGAAPGVGLGRAGPVQADEEGQGIGVN